MSKRKTAIGFGFVPEQGQYHFLVAIPKIRMKKFIYMNDLNGRKT